MECLVPGRLFLVLCCSVSLIIQIKLSLDKLSATDIIRISYTKPLEKLINPDITFCNGYLDNNVGLDNLTIPEIYAKSRMVWESIPYFFTGNFTNAIMNTSFSSPLHFPPDANTTFQDSWLQLWYPTRHYRLSRINNQFCYHFTHKVDIGVHSGVSAVVNLSNSISPYHLFFLHMRRSVFPSERKMFGSSWIVTPMPLNLEPNQMLTRGYEVKKIIRKKLNQPNLYPCVEDGEKFDYIQDCFFQYFLRQMNCVVPNPYKEMELSLNGSQVRLCDRLDDVTQYWALIDHLNSVSFSEFVEDSKCRVPCTREEYKVVPLSDYIGTCDFPGGCSNLSAIYLTFRDREVEYITEKWHYDFNNFIADVGGFMGLYLGASLLMVYDQIGQMLKWFIPRLSIS